MTLEDKIKALMEAKEKKEAAESKEGEKPDTVNQEPAVQIENPITPGLTPEDAKGEELDGEMEPIKEDKTIEEAKVDETTIDSLLTEEFSDEFKLKAKVIFQAAVKSQISVIEESLKEEFNAKSAELEAKFYKELEEKTNLFEEKTSDKIDEYLSYVAEEWAKDNAIAIESGIRTELTEEFISGLKGLFEQHYVDMPEQKVDLYQKALDEKSEMEKSLMTAISNMRKLTEEVEGMKREQIIQESIKDFTDLDAARMKQLVEDFEFEDEKTFKKKVSILKNSFFGKKTTAEPEQKQLQEEFAESKPVLDSGVILIEEEKTPVDPRMAAYLNAI